MSGIQTGIELNDQFTEVIYSIINAVNMTVSTMEDMQRTMDSDVDASAFEGMRDEINEATVALDELMAVMAALGQTQQVVNTAPLPDVPAQDLGSQTVTPEQPRAPPEPIEVPVHWQTDGLEVFTGTGIERFQQEVQSTDSMLNALGQTQAEIATRAAQTNIFPPGMVTDMNGMQNRLQAIQSRIQAIESNPLNMGTDTANAELEHLRAQLNMAVQEQNELNSAVQDMDVSAANDAYLRLSQIISGTERYIRDNVDEQGNFNQEINEGAACASNLNNMISKAVGMFAGVFGISRIFSFVTDSMELFDTQLNAEKQLMSVLANMLDDEYVSDYLIETTVAADTSGAVGEINSIQDNVDDVEITVQARTNALQAEFDAITAKASEIQSRGIYGDEAMIAGAAELSTYFTDADAITAMMDTLSNYAMGMSGGGALDAAAMVDYATGLGKIMSGAYDAMTKKGFEFTDAQKAVIEGTATEAQIAAVLGSEYLDMSSDMQAAAAITQVIDESWAGLYETMSDTPQGKIIQMTNAWGDMKEVIGGQLYPYVILFVDTITDNWGTVQAVLDGFVAGLQNIMLVLDWLFEGAMAFASLFIDNWSIISPVVYGVVAALALYAVYQGIMAAATAVATVAQWAMNSAFLACPLIWITLLIIALVAWIFTAANAIAEMTGIADSGFGVICGGINVVIAFFKNLGLEVLNITLGIRSAVEALGVNIVTSFHNAICSVQSWWYDLLSTALSVVDGICAALNRLPFVDFDYSGITSAADDYAARAAEATADKWEYQSIGDAFNEGFNTFDTFQDGWISEAFQAGAEWGDGVADAVGSFSLADFLGIDIPDQENYSPQFAEMSDSLGGIAGDTGAIKDSLDVSTEELKYLRDIAEQEAVNRYTTAEINIDMSGMKNTLNSGDDIDGFITKLTDSVNEAVDSMTEGVHE